MQGRARIGARSVIFSDFSLAVPSSIFSFVSTSINGTPYNAYWIVIPGIAIWVFHIDDMTWTRWTVAGTPTCIGEFILDSALRWADMKLSWNQYSSTTTWNSLTNPNPFPAAMIGLFDGTSLLFDFTGWSEQPWSITTGEMDYGDPRHENATKKLRLTYKDNGPALIQTLFINEDGDTYANAPTSPGGILLAGIGSGKTTKVVLPVNLPSIYITMQISGEAGVTFEMSSYAPIYSPAGEVRNAL
jgi:drug/metabolite transporter superfamily protein YnfA